MTIEQVLNKVDHVDFSRYKDGILYYYFTLWAKNGMEIIAMYEFPILPEEGIEYSDSEPVEKLAGWISIAIKTNKLKEIL